VAGVEANKGTSQITENVRRAGLRGRDGLTWRQEDKRNGPPTALGAQRDDDGLDEHVPEGMALTANGAATQERTWRTRSGARRADSKRVGRGRPILNGITRGGLRRPS